MTYVVVFWLGILATSVSLAVLAKLAWRIFCTVFFWDVTKR